MQVIFVSGVIGMAQEMWIMFWKQFVNVRKDKA